MVRAIVCVCRCRFNGHIDQRRHSFHSGSPRKRLQFVSADKEDGASLCTLSRGALSGHFSSCGVISPCVSLFLPELQQSESSSGGKPPDVVSQQGWLADEGPDRSDGPPSTVLLDGLHSLAEAEKLFDELTQEKLQVRQCDSLVVPGTRTLSRNGVLVQQQLYCLDLCLSFNQMKDFLTFDVFGWNFGLSSKSATVGDCDTSFRGGVT